MGKLISFSLKMIILRKISAANGSQK